MTIALVAAVVVLVGALAVVAWRMRRPAIAHNSVHRILVPFTGGALDPTVLAAGIRIARAEEATLVPAYLIVVPLDQPQEAPMQQQVARAMPEARTGLLLAGARDRFPLDRLFRAGADFIAPHHVLARTGVLARAASASQAASRSTFVTMLASVCSSSKTRSVASATAAPSGLPP